MEHIVEQIGFAFHNKEALLAVQLGFILLAVALLSKAPLYRKVGPAVAGMTIALMAGSVLPRLFPDLHHTIFPEKIVWFEPIKIAVIPILGFFAGMEISFRQIKEMGKPGALFLSGSIAAPMVFTLPLAILLAVIPNPFMATGMTFLGLVGAVIAPASMRALPTMISFFRAKSWKNDLAKVSIVGGSGDDLLFLIVVLPLLAALAAGTGLFGIFQMAVAVIALMAVTFVVANVMSRLPKELAVASLLGVLLIIAGIAEELGHVHLIVAGLLLGIFFAQTKKGLEIAEEFEHEVKGWIIKIGVPIFYGGLGLVMGFDILRIEPWLLAITLVVLVHFAHKVVTERIGSQLFGGNKAAGRILGNLAQTHGTADILLVVALASIGYLTSDGASGMVLFMVIATFKGFFIAQSTVEQNPDLAKAKINLVTPRRAPQPQAVPVFFPGEALALAEADFTTVEEHRERVDEVKFIDDTVNPFHDGPSSDDEDDPWFGYHPDNPRLNN